MSNSAIAALAAGALVLLVVMGGKPRSSSSSGKPNSSAAPWSFDIWTPLTGDTVIKQGEQPFDVLKGFGAGAGQGIGAELALTAGGATVGGLAAPFLGPAAPLAPVGGALVGAGAGYLGWAGVTGAQAASNDFHHLFGAQ